MKADDSRPSVPADAPFPIVGIGASAGGLEAYTALLKQLPLDTGMGFVLVQHLDPVHESALTQLLSRATVMPVREVTQKLRVMPNCVYVIPPNTSLTITRGVLRLEKRPVTRTPHRPIDSFFESLAQDRRENAIGVVLSGTATDGTMGLEIIKAEGGITFAQDATAKYDSMPNSAVAAGCVDFVLSPENIAKELTRIARHPLVAASASPENGRTNALRSGAAKPARGKTPRTPAGGGVEGFKKIVMMLRSHSGVDFSLYKSSTIQRRITRRMVLNQQDTLNAYAGFLRGNSKELDALYSDVLINVTSFFRNPEAFEVLKTKVFPKLLAQRSDEPLRAWVLGCSTGQEAYSLAMTFMECCENSAHARRLQVFATDLSNAVLDKARHGLYPKPLAQDLSPERLRRFFIEEEGGYRIIKPLREMVVFARQNLMSDPPFSRMDLVSCRNLLIYLEPSLQQKALPTFHYALKPQGYLFLGASESVAGFTDLFEPTDKKHKIYSRKPAMTLALHLPVKKSHGTPPPPPPPELPVRSAPVQASGNELNNAQREADRITVRRYAPASVLINSALHVLQFRGSTGAYLQPPAGKASFDVLKMARDGLMLPLRSAIARATKENKSARKENIRIGQNGKARTVNVEVIPLKNLRERCFLILFEEAGARGEPAALPVRPTSVELRLGKKADAQRRTELETELIETRDFLQSIQEQYEATNEELQASNEEVQSANEELQSVNEELETSKEELESSNEELTTVNEEMSYRNLELSRLNSDLTNLQTSTKLAVVLLGRDLRIRRFSPQAEKLFNLLATDLGRPIGHVRHTLELPTLELLITEVIASVHEVERDVQDHGGHWYSLRVRPYLTIDNKVDGAVLVLVDIDTLKRNEHAIALARDYAQAIVQTVPEPLLILNSDLRVHTANQSFYRNFGVTEKESNGRLVYDLGNRQWNIPELRTLLEEILPRENKFDDFEVTHKFEGIGKRTMLLNARRLDAAAGQPERILLGIRDITEHRQAEEALEKADQRKDEFLATLAHELRGPLAPLSNALQILMRAHGDGNHLGKTLGTAQRQLNHLVHLVEDLLDASRIARGNLALRPRQIELASVVHQSVEAIQPAINSAGHDLRVTLPQEPVWLNADPVRLAQILGNLLTNACKYSGPHGRISISAERQNNEVVVTVKDNGIGIASDALPTLFEMFSQVDHSLERSQGGLGIGLSLVRRLVQMHGGSVHAHSAGLGHGSEFVLRLPVLSAKAVRVLEEGHSKNLPLARNAPAPTVSRRILVVDDNRDSADTLALWLNHFGHQTFTAYDGLEAVAAAETHRPDFVLLDLGLPKLNGFEAARKIRLQPWGASMVLVALTGWGQDEDRRKSTEAGFDAHLVKPVDTDLLTKLLAELRVGGAGGGVTKPVTRSP